MIKRKFIEFFRKIFESKSVRDFIEQNTYLRKWANYLIIHSSVRNVRTRPHPWNTVHSYVSWRGLSDRTWSARHLPESDKDEKTLPDEKALAKLFLRDSSEPKFCPKSTLLFPSFAQYLTDGFIRTKTDPKEPERKDEELLKRTTSNHQIDLCTLYGLNYEQTTALRLKSSNQEEFGRLKSQNIKGEEFAPFLFDGEKIKKEFQSLDKPLGLVKLIRECGDLDPKISDAAKEKRANLFAFGGDRVNSAPQVAMINTLFLREHNRLAGELASRNTHWDDDRVFETARNIVIVEFIKIVVEEYINHISPSPFKLIADPSVAWNASWNKPNWITTEFSLLYRWHPLIPDKIKWGNKSYEVSKTFMNNVPLIDCGLAKAFEEMSDQQAGELGTFNTTAALLPIEVDAIKQGRSCKVAPFVKYQDYLGLERATKMSDISSNPEVVTLLNTLYKEKVDDVEFYVGLFAEDRVNNSPLPRTIQAMVAVDAFSQALTNPLLSEHVFKEETFSTYGWKQLSEVSTLADLLLRNVGDISSIGKVGMTREEWQYLQA